MSKSKADLDWVVKNYSVEGGNTDDAVAEHERCQKIAFRCNGLGNDGKGDPVKDWP